MTVSLEWRPWGLDSARRKIRSAQRHYFSKRYSMMAHMQETEGTTAAMADSAAEVESERLGDALVELETDGISYGELSLTVALHGELDRTERLDGRYPPHLRRARRQGDPRGLRPAPRLVLSFTGSTEETAGPASLHVCGRGGLPSLRSSVPREAIRAART